MREHKVNSEMKSMVSRREWKWALLHSGSLPAQSVNWGTSMVVSLLEMWFLQAFSNRPKLLLDHRIWFRVVLGFFFIVFGKYCSSFGLFAVLSQVWYM